MRQPRTIVKWAGGVVVVGAVAFFAVGCGTTVQPGHTDMKYIALDSDDLKQEIRPEGFYSQWPWNDIVKGKAEAEAQDAITRTPTPNYLQYRAFDSDNTRYYFVPVGRDGMPVIVNAESVGRSR